MDGEFTPSEKRERESTGGEVNRMKVKIALLGNHAVGKTSLISILTENRFNEHTSSTQAAMFINKIITIGNTTYDLQIWDTAGQERFRTIASIYFRDAHGILLVYDVTNRKSYDDLAYWFNEIYSKCEQSVAVAIAGNKADMPNYEVTEDEAAKFAATHKATHMFVSAKNGTNINEIFEALVKNIGNSEVMRDINKKYKESVAVNPKTTKKPKEKKECRC